MSALARRGVPRMNTRMPRSRGLAAVDAGTLTIWRLVALLGAGVGAYHGYKRNHGSIGWAIGWAALGSMVPIVVVPVALAQGLGEEAR